MMSATPSVVAQVQNLDVRVWHRRMAEGDVHVRQPAGGGDRRKAQLTRGDLQLRIGDIECLEQIRGDQRRGDAEEPDLDRAAQASGKRGGDCRGLRLGFQDELRLLEKDRTGGCQGDAAGMSLEQPHPELGFELADRLRERRLGDVQGSCGARYLACFSDRREVAQVAVFQDHRRAPSLGAGNRRSRSASLREERAATGALSRRRRAPGRQ
jgi:hypothetical protein